jgi:hypothetical protein
METGALPNTARPITALPIMALHIAVLLSAVLLLKTDLSASGDLAVIWEECLQGVEDIRSPMRTATGGVRRVEDTIWEAPRLVSLRRGIIREIRCVQRTCTIKAPT